REAGATVTMIDLSFLTKEEQETILTVLKRDAELKKLEDQRVQNLQKSVMNKSQLRYLTGEWFYETKQLRHQDRIHGSDIIRASMRRTLKLKTICKSAASFQKMCDTLKCKISPSKTCHPKVIQQESSSAEGSMQEGSLFKTLHNSTMLGHRRLSSIYPADSAEINVQGSIQFAVNYIQKLGELHIFVMHCRDLATADRKKHRSDPYVKCYLLPDTTKLGKRKTSVKKKTLNPTYSEILTFKVMMQVLKTQSLNVSVWHDSSFGRNRFLGDVNLNLLEWDFSNTQINEYLSPFMFIIYITYCGLIARTGRRTSTMESTEVQIWVKDCKNLPLVRGLIIDPFVKCTLRPDTSRRSRQRTRVVTRTANPMFNHTMVYDGLRPEDLREVCIELTVWDHGRLDNHYIGGLRLGLGTGESYGVEVSWMDSTTDEADLWQRMLRSDGEWVEDVLPLRIAELLGK
uniref:Synaptotagmin-like 2a n=1 Tax=Haplochromis burtoni TaxID=8153 RepID=A0A3Q2WVV7_HAPBU